MTAVLGKSRLAKIAGYPILGKLRAGGQGSIYIGRDPQTGGEIAIKVLSEQMTDDPTLRMRFAQECQVARSLKHPNIAAVVDFGLDGNKPFLAMEYVKGESLGARVDRSGPIPEIEAVAIATQIGKALHFVHQRGLIHRDVTPDNIVVTPDGVAKLIDLGLVKNLNGDFNLTRTKSALGTPNFTAPEQFDDAKRVEPTVDVYGLAATLYMAITGQLPFNAGSAFAIATIYKKKLSNDIAPPNQLVADLSEQINATILQALRMNPKERFATMKEFIDALAPRKAAAEVLEFTPIRSRRRSSKSIDEQERRTRTRYKVTFGVRCQPLGRAQEIRWEGTAIDLSQHGFCMELNRSFQPGTILNIRLGKQKVGRRSVLVRVMWVKKQDSGKWKIGCQYDQPLSEQEVLEFR